mgnify:CR=1 FL=1
MDKQHRNPPNGERSNMNEALKALEHFKEVLLKTDKWDGKSYEIVRLALSRPTFEDAVKVVETMISTMSANQKRLYDENKKNPLIAQATHGLWTLNELLSALKAVAK